MRIGIIGCGALGRVHAARFAAIPEVEVAALADTDPAAIHRAAQELPSRPRAFADYRDLLDAGLDAVCIATPDSLHAGQVLDALAAGLHVFCEKPLTLDPGELEAVISSRDEVDRILAMTYPRRYDRGIQALRREVLSGRWGAVRTVALYDCEDWITPNRNTWRHDPALCPGGFLHDANGHQIDTVLWATGLEAERVRARVDCRGTPVPITAWGTADLTGGVPCTFCFAGDARRWREDLAIHCQEADFLILDGRALWTTGGPPAPLEPAGPGETGEEAFVRLVRGEGPNWAPPDELWPVLRFTRAALESAARGGEEVRLAGGGGR